MHRMDADGPPVHPQTLCADMQPGSQPGTRAATRTGKPVSQTLRPGRSPCPHGSGPATGTPSLTCRAQSPGEWRGCVFHGGLRG